MIGRRQSVGPGSPFAFARNAAATPRPGHPSEYGAVTLPSLLRRARTRLAAALRRFPAPYTLLDRLFAFRARFRRDPEARRARLDLVPLEPRLVPTGRPLPYPVLFVGAGDGTPVVKAYDALTGAPTFSETVFDPAFAGGVRVAAGDLTGDGYPDAVVAAGPGGGPQVRVLDGHTGEQIAGPLGSFFAFDPAFRGGVSVAAADVDGDGAPDVVAAAGPGGGPHVRVFSGATGEVIASFFAFAGDFRGGVSVAAADLTGDGKAEVAVGAGAGGGPRVRVYDPATGEPVAGPLGSFFAFDPGFRGGVFLGADALAGDVDGDGVPDLAVGTGPGRPGEVRVFGGATGAVLRDLAPFGAFAGGVRVGLAYVTDDGFADVVAGTGPGTAAAVRVFDGAGGAQLPGAAGEYAPFGAAAGGVFVAADNDPLPEVTLSQPTLTPTEGFGAGETLSRSGSVTSPLVVTLGISGGTNPPTWVTDFTVTSSAGTFGATGGTVTFAAGVASVGITIGTAADNVVENPNEQFVLAVTGGGSSYTAGTGPSGGPLTGDKTDVTITDDPAMVWVDPADQLLAEGGAAGGVWVYRSGGDTSQPLDAAVGITADPLAVWDTDYQLTGPTGGRAPRPSPPPAGRSTSGPPTPPSSSRRRRGSTTRPRGRRGSGSPS
jgi:hypothetical protein